MHQNAFGGRALPGPAGGAYSAPPDPLAALKGEGMVGKGKEREKGRKEGQGPPQCLNGVDALVPLALCNACARQD